MTKRKKKTKVKPKRIGKTKRSCASKKVASMTREWKRGRWSSRKQAIAVGLSKARKEC